MEKENFRYKVADIVDDLTYDFLNENIIIFDINGKTYCATLFLKRFQLTFIEKLFIDYLKKNYIPTDYPSKPLKIKARLIRIKDSPLNRFLFGLIYKVLNAFGKVIPPSYYNNFLYIVNSAINKFIIRKLLFFIHRIFNKPSFENIKRVFFVDASEIKKTKLDGSAYVYHKYLEGIIDLNSMKIPSTDIIVLYGDYEKLGLRRLLHKNIVVLNRFLKNRYNNYNVPKEVLLEMYNKMHFVSKKKKIEKLGQYLGNFKIKSFDIEKLIYMLLNEKADVLDKENVFDYSSAGYFDFLLKNDLEIISATETFLNNFNNDLEIYLDNFDSTLFTLSQFISENYNHKVIAIQKVLGPYIFSFNIKKNKKLVKEPHKIMTWATFHNECLRNLGYTCILEDSYMYKLNEYKLFRSNLDTDKIKKKLNIPNNKKIVLFSAVKEVLGYTLINSKYYFYLLSVLSDIVEEDNAFVIFKPWPGEDTGKIKKYAYSILPEDKFLVVDNKISRKIHNAEILKISDIMLSTMSSFIGEAIFFGTIPLLINYETCEKYFTREYTNEFKKITIAVNEESDLKAILKDLLKFTHEDKVSFFKKIENSFKYIFGNTDIVL